MVHDSKRYKDEDVKKRVEARKYSLENYVYSIRNTVTTAEECN